MTRIKAVFKTHAYDILVGSGTISLLMHELKRLDLYKKKPVVITNNSVYNLYCESFKKYLKLPQKAVFLKVSDSESSKSWNVVSELLERVVNADKGKNIFIIALGGGVIGDLAGFLAAIYKRGVPLIHIPTTLLAQVDSSIGGKVAIDLACGKNLVGAFYQPDLVISDIDFLKSLPLKEIKNGLSEIIKYGIIDAKGLFSVLEENKDDILKWTQREWLKIIKRCIEIKVGIVEKDEYDRKDIRIVLNLGHTIGHAIETACNYEAITHGEGLAIGLLVESFISNKIGLIGKRDFKKIKDLIFDLDCFVHIKKKVSVSCVMRCLAYDKKAKLGKIRFVLPSSIGTVKIISGIENKIIRSSLKKVLEFEKKNTS